MVKTRQKTKTQTSPNKIIEKTSKIKKNERIEIIDIINVPWNKIELDNQNEFQYELPTKIQLQKDKGSYILIETVQSGGQAVIFKAQKMLENQKIYALKLFKHKPKKKYLESIEKSVPRNINLLKYYDVGYYKDYLVNVTELCDSNLKKEIDENDHSFKSFEEREIMAIDTIKELLKGYFILLNHGIIHRDLKPENILIKDGFYKIADFGFAAYFQETTGTNVGTPGYQSLQVQLKRPYTSKCDVYSLGIIFYELIFKHLPFPKDSKTKDHQVITFPNYSISREAKEFILKCTEDEEENRLSWIQVYNHEIFKGFFKNIVKQLEMIEELNQLKKDVLQTITDNQTQQLKSLNQIKLVNFLKYFNNPHFTRRQLTLVFCILLNDRKQLSGNEILDNLETEFGRVRMAQNGHVACLLTIYTQLIYFQDDLQFFNREKISFNQYHKLLKDIDSTIDKKDVEDSFDILKEEGDVIKTKDFKELLKFKFLKNSGQRK